jgi:nicotinate dehydrogenase subunit A
MTAKALLDQDPKASEAQIQRAMSGVLCRCFTNVRMLRAIQRAGRVLAERSAQPARGVVRDQERRAR